MNRERKILLATVFFAVTGWVAVVALATSVGALKLRAMNAEEDAAKWKRQAGKAYTEMLQARAGVGSTKTLIPAGARIDCTLNTTMVEGKTVSRCEEGTIYPPKDY